MGVPRTAIESVAAARMTERSKVVAEKVAKHRGTRGGGMSVPLPAASKQGATPRVARLFEMISLRDAAERVTRCAEIIQRMRKELPGVLRNLPLSVAHFGFRHADELAQFLGEALVKMETGASSAAEFARGIQGWRWHLAGRLLFERLVKYHPQLDRFFRQAAKEFFAVVNATVRTSKSALVDVFGRQRRVVGEFGRPQKVVEFQLVGADGVTRPFTDFGFIANNAEGLWAVMPIEIKLPAALGKVAEQFSEFLPRLREAKEVIAIVQKKGGAIEKIPIAPSDLVFMQHDKGQLGVAPLSAKRLREVVETGSASGAPRPVSRSDVGKVIDVDQGGSATYGTIYYRVRVLVAREWLEAIVRVLTDP